MKKFLKIFLGVLFAALLLGTFVFLWQKTRPVKVVYTIVQPKLDTLKQFVVATGKVEPRDEVLIKPQISGIVSDVYKEAGQMVRKGEVIATVKVVPGDGPAVERRIARLGSRNIAGADPPRIRPHGSAARQGRRLGRGVRTGAHRPPESRGGTAERQGEPGDRQERHHQPLQGAQQHADPIDDRRYDPRRADQGRKLGDPGQHVQRRYDHRLRSRHVEHALPGQRRRNGRRQTARGHAREADDRRPAERRAGRYPGIRFAQGDRG